LMTIIGEQLTPLLAPKYLAELETQVVIDRLDDMIRRVCCQMSASPVLRCLLRLRQPLRWQRRPPSRSGCLWISPLAWSRSTFASVRLHAWWR
jgi:hypothetical protein